METKYPYYYYRDFSEIVQFHSYLALLSKRSVQLFHFLRGSRNIFGWNLCRLLHIIRDNNLKTDKILVCFPIIGDDSSHLGLKIVDKKTKTTRLFIQPKLYVMLAGPIDKKTTPVLHLTKSTCHIMVDFDKTCCGVNTRIAWQDFFISKLRFIISWLWYVSGMLHRSSTPCRTTVKLYAFKTFNQLSLFWKEKQPKKFLKRFAIEIYEWRENLSNTNVMVEEYLVYRNSPSFNL